MRSGFVTINDSVTLVMSEGKWVEDNFREDEKEVFILVPGNPGFADFYTTFIKHLNHATNIPVWVFSYAGHELGPKYMEYEEHSKSSIFDHEKVKLYNLQDQIEHTAEFIRKYVPADVKIYLLGHSCGSYMSTQLLRKPDIKEKIKKCYFLFPTIQGLQSTTGFFLVTKMIIPFFAFFLMLARLFHYVPFFIKLFLFQVALKILQLPQYMVKPSMKIIHPRILPNIVHLVADEEIHIKDVDYEFMEKNKDLIKLVYGQTDPFVPKQFYFNMKEKIPDIDALMTHMDHGFMVKYDKTLATLIAEWIKECS